MKDTRGTWDQERPSPRLVVELRVQALSCGAGGQPLLFKVWYDGSNRTALFIDAWAPMEDGWSYSEIQHRYCSNTSSNAPAELVWISSHTYFSRVSSLP
ncbi:unnamed protein product [Boreogadus saida]